ncbi:hypothetical protein O0L34_g7449 [Tuta absoluta]|nr:hypothetical protein O0L34_g7449 [Tuta absoluta]
MLPGKMLTATPAKHVGLEEPVAGGSRGWAGGGLVAGGGRRAGAARGSAARGVRARRQRGVHWAGRSAGRRGAPVPPRRAQLITRRLRATSPPRSRWISLLRT